MAEDRKNFTEAIFGAEDESAASLKKTELGKYSDIAVRMFHTQQMTFSEMLIPAVAQFATKLMLGLSVYRTLYFVNVLKIDMVYVTFITALIGIYDVVNNPLMGMIYDRTRTRWGKARPYILFGAIPYYLCTLVLYSGAMFFGETSTSDPKKIMFVFITLFLQETFSTVYNIPHDNVLTLLSPNPKDRITVGLLYQYIGETGSQLIYVLFLPLMELNNKGYINAPMPVIFFVISIITCIIGAAGNMFMAVKCKERIMLQPKPAPISKTLFYVFKNKYALRNFIANFSVSWWSSGGYSWDVVTQQEIFGGSIPSMIAYMPYNIFTTLSVTFIPSFRKFFRNNNRNAVIALRIWDLLSVVLLLICGLPFVHRKWLMVLFYAVFHGLNGLNDGPAAVFEGELGREINDYTEYMTGERPDGTIGILTDLITKVTTPLNALLTIKLFDWSGYDPTITMLPWSQGSKLIYQKVFFLFVGIYILPNIIRMIPYFFYDLVGDKRENMYIALNERRALVAKEHSENEELKEIIASFDTEE